jgi:hypothetical protein
MDTYHTPYAAKQLRRLAKHFSDAVLIDPERLGWRSTAQWLAAAPAIFDVLSGFVVFGDTRRHRRPRLLSGVDVGAGP